MKHLSKPEKKLLQLKKDYEKNKYAILFLETRMREGIGQYDMASILGCAQGTISKIEKGVLKPDVEVYVTLCSLYNVKSTLELITK